MAGNGTKVNYPPDMMALKCAVFVMLFYHVILTSNKEKVKLHERKCDVMICPDHGEDRLKIS